MTTLTATRRRPQRPQRPRRAKGGARRVAALARAELRLLVRNRTAMFTALALPIAMVGLLRMSGTGDDAAAGVGATMTAMMIGFVLLFVVYYNLVSAYVGRREELVLKRLRVGEASDAEILTGTALPSLILALVQTVLMTLGVAMTIGFDSPVNLLLVFVALVGGSIVFVLLAAASTAFTKNVETAQVSTLPVLMVCMPLSGMMFPLSQWPDAVADVARFLPLTPVVDLVNLGLSGVSVDGSVADFAASFEAAMMPVAVLVAWIGVGVWAQRRWFRWEPRG